MKTMYLRAILLLLLAVFLVSPFPAAAGSPLQRSLAEPGVAPENPAQAPEIAEAPAEASARPQWVPAGAHPGFYAARDNARLDPTEYSLVGGHQSFYWDELEPSEGNYRFDELIEPFIQSEVAQGKKVALGILTFNGRANQGNPSNPPYRVPSWVFASGNHHKIICSDGFVIPRYWDTVYMAKYRNFIHALALRYDGDSRVEFIQIGVGKFGESQPCDDSDNATVNAALVADGKTQWTWPYIVNDITAIYADNFHQTRLVLPNAPTFMNECDRQTFTDYAISRGVGLFPAEMYALPQWVDLRTKAGWGGCGKLDRILDQATAETPGVPIAFEGYQYMTPDANSFFWGIAAELSRRADYITLERDVLYTGTPSTTQTPITANIETMRWAAPYMGKHLKSEPRPPSVWVLMRETGYVASMYPQSGNYSFGIEQDDSIAQGRTVPTTYLSRDQIVYSSVCNPATCANPNVEVSQAFLGGPSGNARQGWITRRTDQGSGNRYMWFKISDDYRNAHMGDYQATVTVTYFDKGTDTWQLQYDSTSSGAYKVASTVTKVNSNTWKTATFSLSDARFLNGELASADLRIDCMNDGNEYIHMMDVRFGTTTQQQSISLSASNGGWNFLSLKLRPTSTAIADVLTSIAGKYDLVYAYSGGAWHSYLPGFGGDLATLDEKVGFWVHATQDGTLTVSGTAPSSTTLALSAANGGWNMISWPSTTTPNTDVALASISGKFDAVWTFVVTDAADPWKLYDPAVPLDFVDLRQMVAERGYWIHVTTDCSLVVSY